MTQGHIFTAQAPVVAGSQKTRGHHNEIAVAIGKADHFLRNHGVKASRHDGAGHDLDALAFAGFASPGFASEGCTRHPQLQRCAGL